MKLHQLWRIALWLSIFQLNVFLVFWLELVFPSLEIVLNKFSLQNRRFTSEALHTRFAPRAKCRVHLAWLIRHLLCRLEEDWQCLDCFVIATLWSGKTMVSVLQANLIGCRVGFVLSCFFKSKFNCSLLWPAWAVQPSFPLSFDFEH